MTSPDLAVRPATAADAPDLASLFLAARRASQPAMPPPVHTPEQVHAWFGELLGGVGGGRETWVAEREGILGYLILDPEWLDSLYVRPEETGQGIGTVLLDLAKSLRPGGFGLWVFESNQPAQRFYQRHGLLRLERTDGSDNEEGVPDIAMAWPGTDPVGYLRRRIDAVDTDLGRVLARRAALTAAIQRFKPVAGHEGRDHGREAEIAARLAEHAPNLGAERIQRILHAVIVESLSAAKPESASGASGRGASGQSDTAAKPESASGA